MALLKTESLLSGNKISLQVELSVVTGIRDIRRKGLIFWCFFYMYMLQQRNLYFSIGIGISLVRIRDLFPFLSRISYSMDR